MKHYALYGKGLSARGNWLKRLMRGEASSVIPELNGKTGLLFSETVLEEFIEEDHRHGSSKLVENESRGIRTFSSGEKRKALLEYLLRQHPDFLVLDNPFDCLDRDSVEHLIGRLNELSQRIPVVQLFKRKEDLLPFITEVYHIENEKLLARYSYSKFEKLVNSRNPSRYKQLPDSPMSYKNLPQVVVEFRNVSLCYENKPILNNINWKIEKGEFWQLCGANGSGKTTLLSMIYGDNPKAYGQDMFLFGNKKGGGESVWEIKRKIGYFSPSITELFKGIHTAEEMVVSGLVDSIGLYQKPSAGQISLAREWLGMLGLAEQRNKIFRKLPLLQQRMILIARAMIKHPPLLILDEPSASLDEESALVLSELINIISQESDTAIIYVSHRQEKGLTPEFTLQLTPSDDGSKAHISTNQLQPV